MASLVQPEDAASVLEQFTHDIANIPAEVTHLLEEIQAKDLQIAAFKDEIHKRDAQLQKWVRLNGGHILNPKEDAFSKTIHDCYDKCEILQAEKCGLSEKAQIVLDRQIKRLDIGLRGLAQTEQFPSDWTGPSLLTPSGTAGPNTPAAVVAPTAGPLQAVSGNIGSVGGAPNFANAAQLRLAQNAAAGARSTAASGTVTPVAAARSQREGSTDANKRRRLNTSLGSLPAASSHLRQSSLGPGTPKSGTPAPSGAANSSRAGSAQPSRPSANKKGAQPLAVPSSRKVPPSSKKSGRSRPSHNNKKSSRHRQLARDRATPSTNNSNDSDAESEGSYASNAPSTAPIGHDPANEVDEEDDGGDDTIYCICQKVSFGAMVGCDNDNCPFQWFHYKCVGVTEEPSGEWLCPQCRTLPKNKIKIAK